MNLILRISLLLFMTVGALSAQSLEVTDQYVPDEIIVRIDNATAQSLGDIMATVGAHDHERLFGQDIWLLRLPEGSMVREAEAILESLDDVVYAHPNVIVRAGSIPNDPDFNDQWGFDQSNDADIDAPEAWDLQTDATSVIVAVIDTGVQWDHPDLAANMWTNTGEIPNNGIDDDGNGYVDDVHGYDFRNDDGNPDDDNGHGTHCAGTVGARTNNGIGVAGVCWQAQIMAIKFLGSSGSGSISDSIQAVEYALVNGAHLTSNSWGCYCSFGDLTGLYDAVDAAGDAGQLFVAAAGNSNFDNDSSAYYPATFDLPEVLSVAASDEGDGRASFSNWGATTVDLAAPGRNIKSTWTGSSYNTISGTSMACPHVAGSVALVGAYCPTLTMMDVKQVIMDTVDVLPSFTGLVVTDGRLNLRSALDACAPPPPTVDVAVLSPNGGELIYQQYQEIQWSWDDPGGLVDRVDLWYQDASGQDLGLIAGGLPNNGLYTWDAGPMNDGSYRVRVEALDTNGQALAEDNSDASFRIDRSSEVMVIGPGAGELVYGVGLLSWSATDPDGEIDHVAVYLQDSSGVDIQLLSGDETNDGEYPWDSTTVGDGEYRIRVEARNVSDQVLAQDASASSFIVDNSTSVQVTAPNGGELFIEDTEIQWSASNAHGRLDHIDIYLQDASGNDLFVIAANEPNDGSYLWDNSSVSDGVYRIGIVAMSSDSQRLGDDNSDNTFRVDRSTSVDVLSPNSPRSYTGEIIEITWSATDPDFEITTIRLWLLDLDGSVNQLIAEGLANDGAYTWDISSLPRGAYKIRVEAMNASDQLLGTDDSDSAFTIGLYKPGIRRF